MSSKVIIMFISDISKKPLEHSLSCPQLIRAEEVIRENVWRKPWLLKMFRMIGKY